ncbi:MAG: hypothetical protein [Circoviridae sp.]|nr:MAG: hypothetical protein [Circoviridae sp.]
MQCPDHEHGASRGTTLVLRPGTSLTVSTSSTGCISLRLENPELPIYRECSCSRMQEFSSPSSPYSLSAIWNQPRVFPPVSPTARRRMDVLMDPGSTGIVQNRVSEPTWPLPAIESFPESPLPTSPLTSLLWSSETTEDFNF